MPRVLESPTMPRSALLRRGLVSAAVLGAYVLTSFLYFGLRPLVEPGHHFIGNGYDPQAYVWFMAWWPHAILTGENPIVTHAVWAPFGLNLVWLTSIPGLAVLFAPVTLLLGPIVSYDALVVLLPGLTAWTTYLLCRYLTRALWPSLVGGYLFGFSSYMVAQDAYGGHPNLGGAFVLPLIALVILRFLDGRVRARRLVWQLGLLLTLQFLTSTELAFTQTVFLIAAIVAAYLLAPARRAGLRALLLPAAGAYALAGALVSPFLYYALSSQVPPAFYRYLLPRFNADVANLVIPTELTALGGPLLHNSFVSLANLAEQGAYLGLPILLILGVYIGRRLGKPAGRFLLAALVLTFVLSMGSELTVAAHQIIALPYKPLASLPVFDNLLAGRMVVYTWLAAAVTVALWTAARRPGFLRTAVPVLAVVSIVPNLSPSGFATKYDVPPFFTESAYRTCLDPGETVLALPSQGMGNGHADMWQAASGFRFNLTTGNIGQDIPAAALKPASIAPIPTGFPLSVQDAGMLRAYLRDRGVTSIVVDASDANDYAGAVDQIAAPQVIGGVYLYHLTPDAPSCVGP